MTAPWRLMLARILAQTLRVTARLRVPLTTVVRRLLLPRMAAARVLQVRAVPVSTLVPRMVVPVRVLPVRAVRLRLLSLPLPRRLRLPLPRNPWRLSLQLRRLSRP